MDASHTVRTGEIGRHRLCGQSCYREDIRHELASQRNRVHIAEHIGVEALQAHAVYEYVLEVSITTENAVVCNRVRSGIAALCINNHALVTVVFVVLYHGLLLTRRNGYQRKRSTFV